MDLPTYNLELLEVEMAIHPAYSYPTDFVHPILFHWTHNWEMDGEDKVVFATIYLN